MVSVVGGYSYASRDLVLRELGYGSYADYLASPLWRGIRSEVLARYGGRCRLCLRRARVAHHLGYQKVVLLGENLAPLVPLCHGCHCQVEFTDEGAKRTLADARWMFFCLLGAVKLPAKMPPALAPLGPRRRKNKYCAHCGRKARKGFEFCRPCLRGKTPEPWAE